MILLQDASLSGKYTLNSMLKILVVLLVEGGTLSKYEYHTLPPLPNISDCILDRFFNCLPRIRGILAVCDYTSVGTF